MVLSETREVTLRLTFKSQQAIWGSTIHTRSLMPMETRLLAGQAMVDI